MATTIRIHTLGDSTLDNLYWLLDGKGANMEQAKQGSVEGQLQTRLNEVAKRDWHDKKYTVVSHAYDGFTTSSILNGDTVGRVFPWGGSKVDAYIRAKVPDSNNRFVKPLELLSADISEHPDQRHVVVISVGGNDFRESLLRPLNLLTIVPKVQKQYLEILDKVQAMGAKPILMFQYRTDAKNDPYRIYTILGIVGGVAALVHVVCISALTIVGILVVMHKLTLISGLVFSLIAATALGISTRLVPLRATKGILQGQNPGITMIGVLMEKFYRPIMERASKDRLPVVDLPNTFNPHETKLYISGIEPSKEGGALIAHVITQVIDSPWGFPNTYTDRESSEYNRSEWQVKA